MEVDAKDLIEILTGQRDAAIQQVTFLAAQLKALERKIAELEKPKDEAEKQP